MKFFPKQHVSLRTQLIAYFCTVVLIVGIFFSSYYYDSSSQLIINNAGEQVYLLVSSRMDTIDRDLYQLNSFIDWICLNEDIHVLLKRQGDSIHIFDTVKSRVYNNINDRNLFFSLKNWISSLYIIGDNGLIIKYGSNAYNVDVHMFNHDSWYKQASTTKGQTVYYHAIPNHNRIPTILRSSPAEYVIPVYKQIKYDYNSKPLGKLVILLDSEMLVENNNPPHSSVQSFLMDSKGEVLASNRPELTGTNLSDQEFYERIQKGGERFFIHKEKKIKELITYKKSDHSDYTLVHIQPVSEVTQLNKTALNTGFIVSGLVLLFAFFLSWYLSLNFTKPINQIAKKVTQIAKGNFHHSEDIEQLPGNNEIASLNRDLYEMEQGIRQLMAEDLNRAEEKRQLEIQMLQAQINPHFLNNTLNSIRLMAIMQGAQGIVDMITSLGIIIDCSTRSTTEKITIREELSVIDAYFAIQRVRYKGKVSFHMYCENDTLLDCMIVKFVLQPIVENAIFHGIERKNTTGHITIEICQKEHDILININDDGAGMDHETLMHILEEIQDTDSSHNTKGMGLGNVNKRLKYVYGESYGLHISSKKNQFTQVVMKIPMERE